MTTQTARVPQADPPQGPQCPIGATLTLGLGMAVILWGTWFISRIPSLRTADTAQSLSAPAEAVLLIAVLALTAIVGGAVVGRGALRVGAMAGVLCGLINLMMLGSFLVEQTESTDEVAQGAGGVRPEAPIIALGFIATCAVIGTLGGAIGRAWRRDRPLLPPADKAGWLPRLGIVVVAAFVPVLSVGGAVTSTQAGLAVPDWPNSYGANMWLYPISLMADPRIFLEHTHRLFGTLVGLSTVFLFVYTLWAARGPRAKLLRILTGVLLLGVIVQGVLGGLRVVGVSVAGGIFHGVTAQLLLALAVSLVFLMRVHREERLPEFDDPRTPRRLRMFTTAAMHSTILQLIFGAMYRHMKLVSDGASHAMWAHALWSFLVLILAILAGLISIGLPKGEGPIRVARRAGIAIIALVTVQFLLGWIALMLVFSTEEGRFIPTADELKEAPPPPLGEALITTAHQFNGAAFLALTTLAMVVARRVSKLHREGRSDPESAPAASPE